MPWICPICKKEFQNINQWHSCTVVEIGKHFENTSPYVCNLYNNIVTRLQEFGQFKINPVKTSIQFKADTNFLSLKIKENHIGIEFFTEKPEEKFPIYKVVPLNNDRWLAFAVVEDERDLNEDLFAHINKSYNLCSKENLDSY